MNVLVTGGAGYVGSILSERLISEGHKVIIADNLQQGHKRAVPAGANFLLMDIGDIETLSNLFQSFKIDIVMHLAAESIVESSMIDPKRFFRTNVVSGMNILDVMLENGVSKLIFSSSAAVYGLPETIPISEDHPENPVNSYGASKLIFEHVLKWYKEAYGLQWIALRYFNAAGASDYFGEDHFPETHLIPNILKSALEGTSSVTLFGTKYPTNDGTCIRDYVHVIDIAQAHILAMQKIDELSGRVYNLGTGRGYSVREVLEVARKITAFDICEEVSHPRSGDPPILIASSERAERELGWKPKFCDLETIIGSAWAWLQNHPHGYQNTSTI